MSKKTIIIPLLVAIGLLLAVGVVRADLKTQYVAYAWDVAADKYQNSNVIYPFDGTWESFFHRFDTDTDLYLVPEEYRGGEVCQAPYTTPYAGTMEFGLGHTDSDAKALGAPGFQESRNWEIANCSRDGDSDFDGGDLAFQPRIFRLTISSTGEDSGIWLVSQDIEGDCHQNTCLTEIVTTLFVNFDLNCDGVMDEEFDVPAGVCFYAEARVPPPPEPIPWWAGNLQARITYGGGDKTVNFSPQPATTAVTLGSFAARWTEAGSQPVILGAVAAVLGGATVGALVWRRRPAQR